MRRLLRLSLLALALAAPLAAEQWGFWDYGPGAFGDQAWKEPVADAAALPASGNEIGDVRVTLDDLAAHVWDGDSWEAWAGGGGGSGTVTSVALAVPVEWTVSGSPVTTSGTITIAEATQSANTVYAGPTTGAAAAPGFRALVSADIPNNAADTSGNAATATSASSASDISCTNCIGGTEIDESSLGTVPTATDATNATTAATANAGDSATAFFSLGTIEAARLGSGTPDGTTYLRGDSTWASVSAGAGDVEAVWGCTSGDCSSLSGAAGDSLDAGSADSSKPSTRSTSLPATCAEGDQHQDTDSGGTETYTCTATNTWTKHAATTDTVSAASDLTCTNCIGGTEIDESSLVITGFLSGSLGSTDLCILIQNGTGGSTAQCSAATLTAAGSLTIPSAETIEFSTDTGLARNAAGLVKVTDGSTGLGGLILRRATSTLALYLGGTSSSDFALGIDASNQLSMLKGDGSSYAQLYVTGINGNANSYFSVAYGGGSTGTNSKSAIYSGGLVLASGAQVLMHGGAGVDSAAADTGLARNAAGVVRVTNGSTGIRGFLGGGAAVASATALPVPTGRVFHVTGTTTVTSITSTNFGSGSCVTLIFDDALTFTDGSNLKLAGDFVTTADDTLSLCYDGTNWFETGRSVN